MIPIERFSTFATGLDHPECCAFDRNGNLWAGGEAGQIYRIDPKGEVKTIATLGGFTGGIALSPDDELFVCNPAHGLVHVKRSGEHRIFATHAGQQKLNSPNYPVFDSHGNLYVSDSGDWKKGNGSVVRFDPRGNGKTIAGPFGYTNGLALSADEKTLYMIESDTDRVFRFSIGGNGSLGPAELFAENVGRVSDGLAFDAEGNLYVACYASDEILRISPSGQMTQLAHDRNGMLLGRPTNLTFGGENFDEIFVANLGRYTITRCQIGVRGQPLVNLRS